MKVHRIEFQPHGNEQGILIAIEECKDIPFLIKRVYYMYATKNGVIRGRHAHKCLKQVLICVHGSCKIRLDDGKDQKTVLLDKPYEGLYIEHNIWREIFDFSQDAVLIVLASELYNESDYIRSYEEFLKYLKTHGDDVDDEDSL